MTNLLAKKAQKAYRRNYQLFFQEFKKLTKAEITKKNQRMNSYNQHRG